MKFDAKTFKITAIICALYAAPIILNDIVYLDDNFRIVAGYKNWTHDGRVLADVFYYLFSFGGTLVDVYPLPLILSLAAFSGVVALMNGAFKVSAGIFSIGSFCILANPLMLSNLYFRFDSAFMVLSVSLAILPYCFISRSILGCGIGTVAILASISMYQASAAIFIGLAGIELLVKQEQPRSWTAAALDIVYRVSQLLTSLLVYKVAVLPNITLNSYTVEYSNTLPISPSSVPLLYENAKTSIRTILNVFSGPGILILCCALIIVALALFHALKIKQYLLTLPLSFVACFLASVGLHTMSANYFSLPRMYVGVGLLFMWVVLLSTTIKFLPVRYLLIAPIVFSLFYINFLAANMLRDDDKNARSFASHIITKLDILNIGSHGKIMIVGRLRASPSSDRASYVYPPLSDIRQNLFNSGYDGGRFLLMQEGLPQLDYPDDTQRADILVKMGGANPTASNELYALYVINDTVVIEFF